MAIRIVVAHMPPLRSVSLRFLLASAILLPIMFLRRSRLPKGREWLLLLLLATLMMALPFSATAWAEQWIPSGKTSLLFATAPLVTGWMETWLGKPSERKRLPPNAVVGMLIALAGLIVVLYRTASIDRGESRGVAAVLGVVVLGSASTVLSKQWLKDIPVLTLAAVETFFAGTTLGVASFVVEGDRPQAWTESSVIAMLFLGMFSSALGFLLYYWLLMRIEPYQLAARYFIMPIVALAEGAVLLHERITLTMAVGAVAVMAGMVLALRSKAKVGSDQRKPDSVRP